MAVPRYKAKDIAVLEDTSAIKAKAQATTNIMQRIQAFEAPVMQMLKAEAIGQAEKDFAKNVLEKKDLSTIKDNTIYAQKYNNLTRNSFYADLTRGAKNYGIEMATLYKDDPMGFKAKMDEHRDKLLGKATDEQMKAHGAREFDAVSDALYSRLKANYLSAQMEKEKAGNDFLSSDLEDKVIKSYIKHESIPDFLPSKGAKNEASDAMHMAIAEYASHLGAMADNGLIKLESIPHKLELLNRKAYKENYKVLLNQAVRAGKQEEFLEAFENAKHETHLSQGEIEDFREEIYEAIAKKEKAFADAKKRKETIRKAKKADQDQAFEELMEMFASGSIDIDNVKQKWADGDIAFEHFKKFKEYERNDLEDNTINQSLITDIMAYPTTYTKQAILDPNNGLTNATRQKALQLINSSPKWTNGINYKAGLESIYGKFKVDMNGLVQISNASDMQGLSSLKRAYHDIVSSLPDNDTRERDSKMVADMLIRRFDEIKAVEGKKGAAEAIEKQARALGDEFIKAHPTATKFRHEFLKVR